MKIRLGFVLAASLALIPGLALADSPTLTVAGITSVLPGGGQGTCPTNVNVSFAVAGVPTNITFFTTGMDPETATGQTITVDGQAATKYTVQHLIAATPPDAIQVFLANPTQGSHTLVIKSGTSGVRWRGVNNGPDVDAYLAADYTNTFTISQCVLNVAGSAGAQPSSSPDSSTPSSGSSSTPWIPIIAVIAIVIAGGGYLLARRRRAG
jgi:LPXTG-motif cell wall-anchored protein